MSSKRPAARPARATRSVSGVRLEDGALRIGDREVPLLCGAVHYWRLERETWRKALEETRDLGIPIVETYVPWQVHEIAPGEHDFGRRDPRKDLAAFLDLVAELGLYAFVRPGPHINSEMTYFGLPERIVFDKSIQARSPRQNPVILGFPPRMFPVPSYASDQLHEETGRWYDAVGAIVAPRLHPSGPVVLLQVDNEATYWFRDSQYDQDYHPDALAAWTAWVTEKYGTIEACSEAHRAEYQRWEDVRAPERFEAEAAEGLAIHLDWAAFREHQITRAVTRFRDRMAQAGMKGVPTVHNLPLGEQAAPTSLPALERVVDVCGLDFYHARREHRTIKRRALYLAGTSRLPFAPEMGCGAPYWFTPLTHEDSLFCAMVACAYGVRGLSLYMAVDRDRWYGAPIDAQGNPRIEAGAWKSFFAALSETRFHALEREAPVALVVPREYGRLARATHLLGVLSPVTLEAMGGTPVEGSSEEPLGFAGPIQVLWWRMIARFADALTDAGIPYVYADSDADLGAIPGLRAVIAPSYEFASPTRWEALRAFADRGGLVICGPAAPSLDETLRPIELPLPEGARRVLIDTPDDASRVVTELARDLDLPRAFAARPSPMEVTVHRDRQGARVLFAINPAAHRIEGEIEVPGAIALRDAATGEVLHGHERIAITLAPLSCRMLMVLSVEERAS